MTALQATFTRRRGGRQRGLSLMEILVGIGIGMVAMLIILQAMTIWTNQSRTTSAGADTQINGSIAMYELDRDIKQAGLGFGTAKDMLGCTVQAYNDTRGGAFTFKMQAVEITPDLANGHDQIALLYGNPQQLVSGIKFSASTTTTKQSSLQPGFNVNDVVIASAELNTSDCLMLRISANNNPDLKTLEHVGLPWNNPTNTLTYPNGRLFNMGITPQRHVWRVRNGSLEFYDDLRTPEASRDTASQPVADQVVNMKALYGVASGTEDALTYTWTNVAPSDLTAVRAIRVGILMRSRQYERVLNPDGTCCVNVTPTAPTWFGNGISGTTGAPFVVKNLDGSDGATAPTQDFDNWRRYRYRVYETLIPIRNVIWGIAP